jgi:hypothetical protein
MATQTECCNPGARAADRCLCCPMRKEDLPKQPAADKAPVSEKPTAAEQGKPKAPKRRLSSWEILNGGLTRD